METNRASPGFAAEKTEIDTTLTAITSIDNVLDCVVDPAVRLTESIDDLFLIKEGLEGGTEGCVEKWAKIIDHKISRKVEGIVTTSTNAVLAKVGLDGIMSLVESEATGPSNPMASVIGLDEKSLREKVTAFYSSLGNFPIPSFEEIENSQGRAAIKKGIMENVVRAYTKLHANVHDASSGYVETEVWMIHSPENVEALLSVPL